MAGGMYNPPDCARYHSLSPGLLTIQPRRGWKWQRHNLLFGLTTERTAIKAAPAKGSLTHVRSPSTGQSVLICINKSY